MIYLIVVLLTVIAVNIALLFIQLKVISKEELDKLKQIMEEVKRGNIDILQEEEEFIRDITNKQIKMMFLTMFIILIAIFALKEIIGNEIVIPLPFNNPITGKPGLGWLGSYIVLSFIVGVPLRKALNKILVERTHGLEEGEKKNTGGKSNDNTQEKKRKSL